MTKKQKTNFTFEIDHPETAAPQAIQASVVGQRGLLTFKAVEINELTPCKTNFVFEIQHPKHITAEEIASKMEGGQNCLTFKVLNYEAAKCPLLLKHKLTKISTRETDSRLSKCQESML